MLTFLTNFFNKLFRSESKNEQLSYDPNNIKIEDIHPGWSLDYNGENWKVIQEIEFDWSNNIFSFEFKLTNDNDIKYLYMDDLNGLRLVVAERVDIGAIDETLTDAIIDNQQAPTKITYNNIVFLLQSDKPCFVRDVETTNPENSLEMVCYEYLDKQEQNYMRIEQHTETTFDITVGTIENELLFTNITPEL